MIFNETDKKKRGNFIKCQSAINPNATASAKKI